MIRTVMLLAVAIGLTGCACPTAGRLEWVTLPELRTQTFVSFDRGSAAESNGGFHVHLVSLSDGDGASPGARERAIAFTVDLDVTPNHAPWVLRYQVDGPWPARRYRSVETPLTAYYEDRAAHRLRGTVNATLVESLYGADHDGGSVNLRFDVPLE
ncbi:MAG: hypothetical protein HYR85_25635 [Planctomycetes bacterium]|nr:hypothetical protein [Planctomycetota bacterium]MBI3847737.1 hypothetical protein [Planctomycetota bacterium]